MNQVKKIWNYLRQYGIKLLIFKLLRRPHNYGISYREWRQKNGSVPHCETTSSDIKISIVVPVYNTPELFLRDMIHSVKKQTYSNWELCIADGSPSSILGDIVREIASGDSRVKYVHLSENLGIAENMNAAIKLASGEYIGFMDHDDLLDSNALSDVLAVVEQNSETDVVYTDEDKVSTDLKEYFEPHFKPNFNLELLRGNNYICHFLVVKRQLLEKVGGFQKEYEGAQDYDFIFRCVEAANKIVHVPKILYHWRIHENSTSGRPESKRYAYESGKRAIEAHLKRCQEKAEVFHTEYPGFYRVKYQKQGLQNVSIFVMHDEETVSRKQLKKCVQSVRHTLKNDKYKLHIIRDDAKLPNQMSPEGYSVFIRSTVEVISKDWLEHMIAACSRKPIGAVGIKLYQKHKEIVWHAGMIENMRGFAFAGIPRESCGYFHRDALAQYVDGVTNAFVMIPNFLYNELNRMDNTWISEEASLCKKIRALGYEILFYPFVEGYICEKISRKPYRHLGGSTYYNPNLSLRSPGFYLE